MSIPLFDRFDKGDSQLTEEGEYVCREASRTITGLVEHLEEVLGKPIDLRDLKSVMHEVVSEVLLNQIICRRLAPDYMKPEIDLSFYEPNLDELPSQGWPPSTYNE